MPISVLEGMIDRWLTQSIRARDYGETLRGAEDGYEVKLSYEPNDPSAAWIRLFTRKF